MYIGTGIFLLVVGAILNWGVADRLDGVNLHTIGLICMAGGALALLMSLLTGRRDKGYAATKHSTVDATTGTRVEHLDVERS
jgi:hypothetical protein